MSGKIHEYEGKNVKVSWDAGRCIHVRECVRGLPGVFDPDRRPWVDADADDADKVAEVVTRCPTGALKFERLDGGPSEPAPTENHVEVEADGPIYVKGDVVVESGTGKMVLEDTRVALCRCGASENKPFCDGRHTDAEFKDEGRLAKTSPRPDEFSSGGRLTVKAAENGPLLFQGWIRMAGAGGRARFYAEKAALCRCGASETKPFCDGTHKTIGFVAT